MNLSFSIEASHQILINTIDHTLSKKVDLEVQIASWVSLILICISNGYLIQTMKNQMKSGLDWLIMMDSVLYIINCIPLIRFGIGFSFAGHTPLCLLFTFLTYFTNTANRLITVGISIYRYVIVVRYSSMQTKSQRDFLTRNIFSAILWISLTLTGFAIKVKDAYAPYNRKKKSSIS